MLHVQLVDGAGLCCRIFDKDDDGFISVEELRHIMLNLGDKMTDRELNDMLEEADSYRGNGLFNYQGKKFHPISR